ncbi:assimilatory sulfite reductase (NADPH) flavoprotein subunit [Paenibacillus camelliae]|uniref:assimilatory sulfite reductase (NADPH) flavoprotein subunit n=1 Tax=Paenibacillus camelliae TaxID=512410 RepID=UPI00203BB139|nr:assimilatory sulfite reductase (NADPH) flavoprotein subunit [Paenibacillus camelliae]MCM3633772.1 assimilatory sulfite reductase (NADPH) flavoprotein subunit [Paenibacillus camelliae]
MQLLVTNSPFSEEQLQHINALLPTLTETQIHWLSGYLAFYRSNNVQGALQAAAPQGSAFAVAPVVEAVQLPKEATIIFGSQTGNAQRLAGRLADRLKADGYDVTVSAMNKFKPNDLKKVVNLFVLVSTHGEGDPPDNAVSFYEFLHGKRAPELKHVKYSVLALGDTSYEFFCKTGQDFDARLKELGAEQLVERADCDVDYEETASGWINAIAEKLNSAQAAPAVQAAVATEAAAPASVEYTRNKPFQAEVIESINLNGRGSDRETRHLELSLEGSGIIYEPGDAVGIVPHNDPELVKELIEELGWKPSEQVTTKDGVTLSVEEALTKEYEITTLSKTLLEKFEPFAKNDKFKKLLGNAAELKAYVKGRDLLDLIQDYGPFTWQPSDVVSVLRKIPARLYSIASSLAAHPDEVHLTIRKVQYDAHGRQRNGVCSVYVSERLEVGDHVSVFVQSNPNFKLPASHETPIIMIGPGTGVAPFRAFMEEREEAGASGKSWLFFGDRHYVTDFLYQTDWQRMLNEGALTNLEVAFSRDTEQKVYVQHRLLEHAAELYAWLEEGAHLYICGDEKHMAHDVHEALLQIIQEQRGVSAEAAAAYLSELQDAGRYQRDVY